jgi:arsenite oxidase small subunit
MTSRKPSPPCASDLPPGTFRLTRRDLVKATGVGLSGYVLHELAAAAPADTAQQQYPETRVADVDALKVDVPVPFTYPDETSPAMVVRLREGAAGGVGPGNTIVAFSQLCTHKGCPVSYRPERKLLICPCHWSSFDPAKAGQMVIGQASQALPQIRLRITDNVVFAVGVDGLIFGRHTNML